jgi:heptosyltransferase-2
MRILLIQTAFLGDVVMTTPLIREVRRRHPSAELHMLTTAVGQQALEGMSEIDRWLVIDKRWNRWGRRSYASLLKTLAREQFDIGIAAQRSFRSGLMLRLANPELSVGFEHAPGAWAYAIKVERDTRVHAVDRYLDLATALGPARPVTDREPNLPITESSRAAADRLLHSHGFSDRHRFAAIAPGSRWETKRWTPEGFAAVARQLTLQGLTPILVGSAAEQELCTEIRRLAGLDLPQLAGQTSIGSLAALLQRSELVVANDSGAAHVAAAVGTSVVAIFGPTASSQGYVPRGAPIRVVERDDLSCRPCGSHGGARCPLRHHACMVGLDVRSVLSAVDELLSVAGREVGMAAQSALAAPG